MGGLRQAARRGRRVTPAISSLLGGSNSFLPTQPGDPDFSLAATPGSQLQFPAAAGESRINDISTRATNQLQAASAAGLDVTGSEYDALREAAAQGLTDRKPTLGESLLGWLGAPFETVNLLIQDVVGGGDTNVSLGDYGNALWGGVEDDQEFKERTGVNPASFSDTLTLFGWEESDTGFGRTMRGLVDFGSSMLIDPLTYVTGGLAGLGRKAGVAAGRGMQAGVMAQLKNLVNDGKNLDEFGNVLSHVVDGADDASDYAKHLARTRQQTLDDFHTHMEGHLDNIAQGNFDDPVVADLNRYLGDLGPNGDNVFANWEELATAHRIGREVLQPLSQRNFEAIAPLALEELPVWARGGIRLGLPSFSTRFAEASLEIPGTRGLGRKLLGNPMREMSAKLKGLSPKYKKVAEAMSSGRLSFDSYRPILNGLRDGTFEPWQAHMLFAGMDNIHNQAYRQAVTATLHHHAKTLNEIAENVGEDRGRVYRTLVERMELSGDDSALYRQAEQLVQGMAGTEVIPEGALAGIPPELDGAITDAASYMRSTMDTLHGALSKIDPKFKEKYIDGYVPHIMTDEGRDLVNQFIRKGANVPRKSWVNAADHGEPGKGLLARIMNAVAGGGMAETSLGSSRFVPEREHGRLQAQLLADDGPVLLDESTVKDMLLKNQAVSVVDSGGNVATEALTTKYASVNQLNDWLSAAVTANAEEYGIVIPKGWDGKVFKDNPLEVVAEYVGAMDDTIKQWTMIDAMKMAGVVTRHSTAIDVQDVLQKMMANVNRIAKKVEIQPEGGPGATVVDDIIDKLTKQGEIKDAADNIFDSIGINTALNDWSGDSTRIRKYTDMLVQDPDQFRRLYPIETKANRIFMREALALMKGFEEKATPFDTLLRLPDTNETQIISQLNVGDTYDIIMQSTSAGHEFLRKVREAESGTLFSHKGAELYFDEGTRGIKNTVTTHDEQEVLVSGKFTVKEILDDPDTGIRSILLGNQKPILTPKKPTTQNILEGKKNLIDGVPKKAISPMRAAGMDPSDIGGTRQLYQTMESMTRASFREMRAATLDPLPEAVGAGLRVDAANDVVHFAIDPSLKKKEVVQLRERAIRQLDDAFMSGDLKGRLNHETMTALARNAPNQESSDLLYAYFKNKMASLGDGAKEYLGKNPGEFVDTTVLADEWFGAFNDFVTDYSAYRTTQDELVSGGQQARQLASHESEFANRLKGLRKAARELKERGYDEAVQIMRQVNDVTGVADLPNYIKPHELGLAGPAVEGMQIQRDVGLWLKNVARNTASVYTPEGVAAAKFATGQLLRTWRALATLPRPAFHIRNAMGAAWMNMATGVRAETYAKVGRNGLRWRKALREGVADPYSVIDADIREAWKAMNDRDVLSGFVSSEFRAPLTGIEKEERLKWLNVADPENFVLTRVGGRSMESIEDVARAALFLEYYDPKVAGSAVTASEMVRAIHFDYSDLTPWETKIKSLVPFFVWTRRNLPRQLEMMVERPAMIQRYKHIMQSMNDNFGGNDDQGMPTGDLFSAYAAGTNYYVNPGTPFWARIMIDPDLPVSDLLNLPNPNPPEVIDFANDLLGPHVGTLININEQREFGDVNAPAPLNFILKGLAAIGMYDETIDGDVRIPFWMRTIQETALPFTRDVVDPLTGGPTDPNRQQRLGISQDDNPVEAGLKNLIASLGRGVGVKFNTPVDVRSTAARSQDELDRIIQQLRDEGKLPGSDSGSASAISQLLG